MLMYRDRITAREVAKDPPMDSRTTGQTGFAGRISQYSLMPVTSMRARQQARLETSSVVELDLDC